ncbi:MAG: hypothetical protein WDA22_10780 [Bacteroidota bacterium]
MPNEKPETGNKIFFFVDNKKYETEKTTLTGGEIKAMISGFDPSYSLFLEGPGDEPDRLINDSETISLEKDKGPKRFYTVPPANFGIL